MTLYRTRIDNDYDYIRGEVQVSRKYCLQKRILLFWFTVDNLPARHGRQTYFDNEQSFNEAVDLYLKKEAAKIKTHISYDKYFSTRMDKDGNICRDWH